MTRVAGCFIVTLISLTLVAATPEEIVKDYDASTLGIGVSGLSKHKEMFKDIGVSLPTRDGVVIINVANYGPAHQAKLGPLDIITRIGSQQIKSTTDFDNAVKSLKVGEKVKITGYHPTEFPRATPAAKKANVKWRKGDVEVRPVKQRDMFRAAMQEDHDKIKDLTFFTHRDTPKIDSGSDLNIYFSTKNEKAESLRLRLQYVSDEWLFIKQLTVKVDDKSFVIDPPVFNGVERDHSGGKIWEWYDIAVGPKEREMIEAIITGKETTIRYHGKQYQKDRSLDLKEKERLQMVFMCYKAMGGK